MRISAVVRPAKNNCRPASFGNPGERLAPVFRHTSLKGCLNAVSLQKRLLHHGGIKSHLIPEKRNHLLCQSPLKIPEMQGGGEEFLLINPVTERCPDHKRKRLNPRTVGVGCTVSLFVLAADDERHEDIVNSLVNKIDDMPVHQLYREACL